MINNLKTNNKNKTHSFLSRGWKSTNVGSSMIATNPTGPLIPAMDWLYVHLNMHMQQSPLFFIPETGKTFLAPCLPSPRMLHHALGLSLSRAKELLQEKMPQEMRSASMVLPKRIPVWLLLPVSHIQLLSLCFSLLHEFLFTFLTVYCILNSYVATIHRRTMGTGRQWMTGM